MKALLQLCWVLSAVGIAHAAEPAASAALIPAKDFARYPTFNDVQLSPQGDYLAISGRAGTSYSLAIIKWPEKKLVSGLQFAGDSAVGAVFWTSNDRVLIEMAVQEFGNDDPLPTGELFAMNVDGSGKQYLYGYQGATSSFRPGAKTGEFGVAEVVKTLSSDPQHALVTVETETTVSSGEEFFTSHFTPLYSLNVLSGSKQLIARAPMRTPSAYLADDAAKTLIVTGTDDQSYEPKTYWRQGDADWQRLPFDSKGLEPIRITADGSRAYFRQEEPSGRECLLEWQLPQTPAVAGKPREVVCKPSTFLGRVYFSREERPFAYSQGERPAGFIDVEAAESRALASLQAQFAGQIVTRIGTSRNHNRQLYFVRSDQNSGEYYLYDADTRNASFLDAAQAWLEPDRMATMKALSYKARDGLEIDAFLTLPQGRAPEDLPLVVMPHGGPIGVSDRWGFDSDAQFLASRGYAVLQMNYRGSGGQGEAFEKKGFGEWGGKIIDDITDGARWAVASGLADPKRMCIFGASYGGYAALMSAVREPDLYRCAIGFAGIYDLNLLIADSDVTKKASGRQFWSDSIAATPEARAKQSPINQLDRLKAAVMIIHGERDVRAPYSQALALRKALEARGKPYAWLVNSEGGHGFFDEKSRTDFYEKLEAFLEKQIGK